MKQTWPARPHAWCITESASPAIASATVLGDIRDHIDRLLRESHFKDNVRRLQQSYAAYVDGRVAERSIDSLLSRPADHESVTGDTQP